MFALEVELVVAVTGHVDFDGIKGVDHLPPVFDVGEGGGGEAVT